MCLKLYVGSVRRLPLCHDEWLAVREAAGEESAALPGFDGLNVYVVGAHTGCGCGFPSVKAELPVGYYEGLFEFEDPEEREKTLRSAARLIAWLKEGAAGQAALKLYPVWDGDEGDPPLGLVQWRLAEMDPGTLLFTEAFVYELNA